MSDTLKERLDASMSAVDAATCPEMAIYHEGTFWDMLDIAYRSGDLVTKEELEAAVSSEREACAYIAYQACLVPPDGGSPTEEEAAVCDVAAKRIRARGDDQS